MAIRDDEDYEDESAWLGSPALDPESPRAESEEEEEEEHATKSPVPTSPSPTGIAASKPASPAATTAPGTPPPPAAFGGCCKRLGKELSEKTSVQEDKDRSGNRIIIFTHTRYKILCCPWCGASIPLA